MLSKIKLITIYYIYNSTYSRKFSCIHSLVPTTSMATTIHSFPSQVSLFSISYWCSQTLFFILQFFPPTSCLKDWSMLLCLSAFAFSWCWVGVHSTVCVTTAEFICQSKLLWTLLHKSLEILSQLLAMYLGIELLGHIVSISLVSNKLSDMCSKVVAPPIAWRSRNNTCSLHFGCCQDWFVFSFSF